jgi:hypothetical protein
MRTLGCASVVFLLLAETAGRPVSALAQPLVVRPTAPIALFNGRDLSNFETWLVDHHEEDPDRVFSVVDQIDGGRPSASAASAGVGWRRASGTPTIASLWSSAGGC